MTITHTSRRIVEDAIDAAVDIVDNKLHAMRTKSEREFSESSNRVIMIARMIIDTRLHLERIMLEDAYVEDEGKTSDPDLFTKTDD